MKDFAVILLFIIAAVVIFHLLKRVNGYYYDERQKMHQRTAALHGLAASVLLCILFALWIGQNESNYVYAPSLFYLCGIAGFIIYIIHTIWTDSYRYVNDRDELFPYWSGIGVLGIMYALNLYFIGESPFSKEFWAHPTASIFLYGLIGCALIDITYAAKFWKEQHKIADTKKANCHLIKAMADKKLSSTQLAAKVHISEITMNAITNGEYVPSVPLAVKICRQLNCTLGELFDS